MVSRNELAGIGVDAIYVSPLLRAQQTAIPLVEATGVAPVTLDALAEIEVGATGLSQEEVDQVYARISAGPIPDGVYDGDLFFPGGADGKSRMAEIIGGRLRAHEFAPEGHSAFDGIRNRVKGRIADFKVAQLENLGRALWTGKVFYRNHDATVRPHALLRNRMEHEDRPVDEAAAPVDIDLTAPEHTLPDRADLERPDPERTDLERTDLERTE